MSRSVYGRRGSRSSSAEGDQRARSQHSWIGRASYWVIWFAAWLLLRKMAFRMRVEGVNNFPDGPFILAPIHRSFLDMPMVSLVKWRRMRFMGKESLWDNKALGALLNLLGGFPVQRGTADRIALRAAEDVLAIGEPLVMFPEGTRKDGDRLRRSDILDGPAFVAMRTGVPIVPMGLGGTVRALPIGAKVPRPRKVVAVVGDPIMPPPRQGKRVARRLVTELTDRLYVELNDLYIEARVLAGQEPAPGEPSRSRRSRWRLRRQVD